MKKKNEIISEDILQKKRHLTMQKLMAGVLCICLIIVSLPMEFYGSRVFAEESQKKIMSFTSLPEEIRLQTVNTGVPLEELNLPDTLEAVCVPVENMNTVNGGTLSLSDKVYEIKGIDSEEVVSGESQEDLEGTKEDVLLKEDQEIAENPEEAPVEDDSENPESSSEEVKNTSEGTPEVPISDFGLNPVPDPETEIESNENLLETVIIENITWTSAPEYDSKAENVYVFVPIISDSYVLAERVELPKIYVTVKSDEIPEENKRRREQNSEEKRKESKVKEKIIEELKVEEKKEEYFTLSQPGCGIISENTVWNESGTLSGGELVVNPDVTLTINNTLKIDGNVTVRGGGTIVRGSGSSQITVPEGASLIMKDIILDGKVLSSGYPMIAVNGNIVLDDGCIIQNFKCDSGTNRGSVCYLSGATAELNDAIIENCISGACGGAIYSCRNSSVTINKGTYRNNQTTLLRTDSSACGGGFIYTSSSNLYIYGGNFIENTTIGRGGAIYHAGDLNTKTYLYGGVFRGNSSSWEKYAGSGAIWNSSVNTEETYFDISSNVKFCGDGTDSGVDGIFLDSRNSTPRKIKISNTLSHLVTLYVNAIDGYVIAEGTNNYILLHKRDMKKIKFVDVGGSGEKWYALLDSDKNQVKISKIDPGYKYFVYYISNGAKGTVVDDNEYEIGESTFVKPADELSLENATFQEWNTDPDGKGKAYQPGEELKIEGDTDLYAIFQDNSKKTLTANFYSGNECEKNVQSVVVDEFAESGTVKTLELQKMDGWEPVGWEKEDSSGYNGEVKSGQDVILTEPETDYYGIYKKDIILSYEAEGIEELPNQEKNTYYANVHNEISYKKKEFTIAPALTREGYTFTGWNTKPDGTGERYEAGGKEIFMEDTTLYAMFLENGKKDFTADFYSGGKDQKETVIERVEDTVKSVNITVPELKEMPGWLPLGWDTSLSSYTGSIVPGTNLILDTENSSYYGIYEKNVILSYNANGGDNEPKQEKKLCHANVHGEITYDVPEFTIASAITRDGYIFSGWNTEADGSGDSFEEGSAKKLDSDITLYAVWEEEPDVAYKVEYYKQDLEGDGYTRDDSATENLFAKRGAEVEAAEKEYTGFALNTYHPSGKMKGTVEGDGSLVLKLYYDRNIYEVDFNLNGGYGKTPDTQKIRYGGLLKPVDEPARKGYNFKGWHLDDNGLDGGLWDFGNPVENNTDKLYTTLYAIWEDELAPVMEEASFSTGHKDFLNWVLQRKSIVITVPIIEEGSGLAKAEYLLMAEDGTEKDGLAQIEKKHELSNNTLTYGSGASIIRAVQAEVEQGVYAAKIPIEEEFKGKVYLTCTDYAGNASAQKTLTAAGGGIIIEDNAPEISFSNTEEKIEKPVNVKILVKDDKEGNITGGIAGITYQVDKEKEVTMPKKNFSQEIVESYKFTVKVSGEGKHTLWVKAEDHAGNKSERQITLKISGKKENPAPVQDNPKSPGKPRGIEPRTGDSTNVKVYATVAMIAGFSYLLLYFEGEHGITEQEKEEIVYRLVGWAKKGGKLRRMLGIAVISVFLAYYYSIGKSVPVQLKEVYAKGE